MNYPIELDLTLQERFGRTTQKIKLHLDANPAARVIYSNQNVVDLLSMIQEDRREAVRQHYQWRAIHCPAAKKEDVVLLPVTDSFTDEGRSKFERLQVLAAAMESQTGIHFVVVDEAYLKNNPFNVITSAYYVGAGMPENGKFIGANPEHVRSLKNKAEFGRKVIEAGGADMFVPQVEVRQEEVIDFAKQRLAEIKRFYVEILSYATAEEAAILEGYVPGVVVRPVSADGGFGSFFLSGTEENGFSLKYEKTAYNFANWIEVQDFIKGQGLIVNDNYVISREIDVNKDESPSLGTYMIYDGPRTMLMPMTYQLMKNSSCVGGGSYNAVNGEFQHLRDRYEKRVHAITAKLLANNIKIDEVKEFAHIGVDTIVAGIKEFVLKKIIDRVPELAKYKGEAVEVALVESNPRYTSLSLSVWAVVQAIAHKKRMDIHDEDVLFKLIGQVYGLPDEQAVGGFFVWDYLEMPEGVENEVDFVDYIEKFNAKYEHNYGIFLLPRIAVNQDLDTGKFVTSLVMGLTPTKRGESVTVFRKLQQRITEQGLDHTLVELEG